VLAIMVSQVVLGFDTHGTGLADRREVRFGRPLHESARPQWMWTWPNCLGGEFDT